MAQVAVVGDGPAGLSAALFLAKAGHKTVVYAQDETPMHFAQLYNYLGISQDAGPDFQARSRSQVRDHGATIRDEGVASISRNGTGFRITCRSGDSDEADYLILAAGKAGTVFADQLGLEMADGGVATDRDCRTNIERVYAVGRLSRPQRSQAIISAGAGAVAALDILSLEAGQDVTDWDKLPSD